MRKKGLKTLAICLATVCLAFLFTGCEKRQTVTPPVPPPSAENLGAAGTVGLEVEFPEIKDFASIPANVQSCDPSVYNFQMFARQNGLFFYFVQYTTAVETNTDKWQNTHVEMEIWQGNFGYGWDGTYAALFLDGSVYLNHHGDVRSFYYKHFRTPQTTGEKIEYFFWIEFDNNTDNGAPPYAYVKQYQMLPGVTQAQVPNSVLTVRDNTRTLISGDEKSWEVHESITRIMYT